jgi:hypothetical protein
MGWIGCVRCEKFWHDFAARTFALIAEVQPVLHKVSCSNERIPNTPKHQEFTARTFALIAPVQPILHQVSCSNETIPNASKHCKTHQKGALRSNGLCWVRSMWKISTRIHGTNFCIIAPVKPILYRVSCSNETIPNAPKHYETHQNMGLGSNGVVRVRSLWKIPTRLRGTNFCINCISSARLAPSFMQ